MGTLTLPCTDSAAYPVWMALVENDLGVL